MPILGETRQAKELGYSGSMRLIWSACCDCGAERWVATRGTTNFKEPQYKRCFKCARVLKIGAGSPLWKGGKGITSDGYVTIVVTPDDPFIKMADHRRRIFEHRLVVATHLKRCLKKTEWVHHLNGIRTDNRFENLALVNSRNHPKHTLTKLMSARIRQLEQLHLPI